MFEGGNATMDREFPRLDHLVGASIVRDKWVPAGAFGDEEKWATRSGVEY